MKEMDLYSLSSMKIKTFQSIVIKIKKKLLKKNYFEFQTKKKKKCEREKKLWKK